MQCIRLKRKFDVTGSKHKTGSITNLLRRKCQTSAAARLSAARKLQDPYAGTSGCGGLGPKMALPIRTIVAPQRMAWT